MVFQGLEVRFRVRRFGPQNIVVVGEGGEQDAQEEAGRCAIVSRVQNM